MVVRIDRGEGEDPRVVDIWVDPVAMLATRADYTDAAGNNHRYEMTDVTPGPQPEEKFTFTIPEGVTVVDMRHGETVQQSAAVPAAWRSAPISGGNR